MKNVECVILGAGLSGLACALTMKQQGVNPLVIEKNNFVGGRVTTNTTAEGFLIDEGFQVLLSSYPELSRFVDLQKLNLQKFNSGALIYDGKQLTALGNPLVHPSALLSIFQQQNISLKDIFLVGKLIALSQLTKTDTPLGNKSTLQYLNDFGFSQKFIDYFWKPFLTGVFLDPSLAIGSDYFKFLIRSFAMGNVTLPENGMSELPRQMSQQLDSDSIWLSQDVVSWNSHEVVLSSGQKIQAKKVICTFDPTDKINSTDSKNYHSVSTYYFTSDTLTDLNWNQWLILVPRHLGFSFDHMTLISSVAKKYGNGHPLLSVSVVGDKNVPIEILIKEINQIAQKDLGLRWVTSTVVHKALPNIRTSVTEGYFEKDGIIYCGDRWASPSINGALKSGRLAALKAISDIKNT